MPRAGKGSTVPSAGREAKTIPAVPRREQRGKSRPSGAGMNLPGRPQAASPGLEARQRCSIPMCLRPVGQGHPGQGRAASAAAGRTSGVGHFKAGRVRIIELTPVRGRRSRAENPGRHSATALEAAKTQACIAITQMNLANAYTTHVSQARVYRSATESATWQPAPFVAACRVPWQSPPTFQSSCASETPVAAEVVSFASRPQASVSPTEVAESAAGGRRRIRALERSGTVGPCREWHQCTRRRAAAPEKTLRVAQIQSHVPRHSH